MQRGIWFILVTVVLVGLSIWVNLTVKPRLGLDVDGGIRFTILADKSKLSPADRTGETWNRKALQTVGILEGRAAQSLGVAEASVYRKGDDRFVVELPGLTDEEEARKVITTSAQLQYYWASNVATDLDPARPYEHSDATIDTPNGPQDVDRFKRRGQSNDEYLKLGTPEYDRMFDRWKLITKGENLRSAEPDLAPNGRYNIKLSFKPEGEDALSEFARSHVNRREWLVAVIDREVVSFSHIKEGVTSFKGGAVLEGRFTPTEAKRLSGLLTAGALPVDLKEQNVTKIAPSIGRQALSQMLVAGFISFGVIAAFLLVYYMFPGFVALLALLAYISLSFAVFKWIGVTFSLAAIAGFILSVGMAVDANILIFERLKEELRTGRTLMTAIDLGFKRAFPAILDSNACTVITSLVLINIGTGPVKGFATTLMIGVFISLFTAVTVTRTLLLFFVSSGIGKNPNLYGTGRGWFGERLEANADKNPLHIVKNMARYFIISFLIIVPGLIFMGMGGLKLNFEFLGGIESGVRLPKGTPATSSAVSAMIEKAGFKGANAKIGDAEEGSDRPVAYITIPPRDNPEVERYFELSKTARPGTSNDLATLRKQLGAKIVSAVGGDPTPIEKVAADGTKELSGIKDEVSFESAGPAVRAETIRGAVIGVIVSSVLIVLYLAIRFGVALGGFAVGLRFGLSAIIAMLHDVVVILGLSAIMGYFRNWEVSQLTITAMLTVIGFSVHDTIVIFDRIRENLRRPLAGESFDHLVDRSITQSFARSLNTSGTVIVTLAILVFIGSATPDLKHFSAAMLIGIVSGTYSSIFNAAPILVLWERWVGKRKGAGATIIHDKKLREPGPVIRDETVWTPDDDGAPAKGQYSQTKRRKKR
ncbi:MAG: protein translocase subunit SecD [Armatimonadetes bacterium]|nr:protein translocase subunit SecD [Armatimonadota bacterium]